MLLHEERMNQMRHWKEFDAKELGIKKSSSKNLDRIITLDTESSNVHLKEEIKSIQDDAECYKNGAEIGYPYIWDMSIENSDGEAVVFYGRTLEELREFFQVLHNSIKGKFFCFVQNLGHDFQFLRNVLSFDNVFAREPLKPIKAVCNEFNVEFRCSYILSNSSLEDIAKNNNLDVFKKVGFLDYDKIRNELTPLNEREMEYCECDCLVIHEYIKKERSTYRSISQIPLTQTGKVRRALKESIKAEHMLHHSQKYSERWAIKDWKKKVAMMAPNPSTYWALRSAFCGGYVHANREKAGRVINCVESYDFTSSYIYTLLTERFPMSYFVDSEDSIENLDYESKAYLITVRLTNIESVLANNYLSSSKMEDAHGIVSDNGRILCADFVTFTCTEQDWLTIDSAYAWDECEVLSLKESPKDWMPDAITKLIVRLYSEKQKYKGVEGKENVYQRAKEQLNAIWGMMVTNNIVDEIKFGKDGWKVNAIGCEDVEKALASEAEDETNLLPMQWGVWVSAYARRNLWKGIIEIDSDVVYDDTDSIKFVGDHEDFIESYNKECFDKVEEFCRRANVDPKNLHPLGEFDHDGSYSEFITLGAKKYAYRYKDGFKADDDGRIHVTLSGVKKNAYKALKDDITNFKDGFVFESSLSGSLTHYYNNEQPEVGITDYLGNKVVNRYKYGVCLTPCDYTLGQSSFSEFVSCIITA